MGILYDVLGVLGNLETIKNIWMEEINPVMNVGRVRTMPSNGGRAEGLNVSLVLTVSLRGGIIITPLNFGRLGGLVRISGVAGAVCIGAVSVNVRGTSLVRMWGP